MPDHPPGIYVIQRKRDDKIETVLALAEWSKWSPVTHYYDFGVAAPLDADSYEVLAGPFTVEQIMGLRWIPVKERLPEMDAVVLVWRQGDKNLSHVAWGYRTHKYQTRDEWEWREIWSSVYPYCATETDGSVTHWMPTPLPPERKEPHA